MHVTEKILLYIDILGFQQLPELLAAKIGSEAKKVRREFIKIIGDCIKLWEAKGTVSAFIHSGKDDWIIVCNDINDTISLLSDLLTLSSGYDHLNIIPLEIAVHKASFDSQEGLEDEALITEDVTIEFLKTNVIGCYRAVNLERDGKSPEETFILFTEEAFRALDVLERKDSILYNIAPVSQRVCKNAVPFWRVDAERLIDRGRFLKFLRRIGRLDTKYHRVGDLYIPPAEYSEIAMKLETKHIVFITGTPEFGKTYTAARLLWEYYLKGYEPAWHIGEEKSERQEVRRNLSDIKAHLRAGSVIYFEDPFGKVTYEKREVLERDLSSIIETIKSTGDVRVIITSREEVFKEFSRDAYILPSELEGYVERINIRNASYSVEKRKEMLIKWAEARECGWLDNADLRLFVLQQVEDGWLPTPLNIEEFTQSTKTTSDIKTLMSEVGRKSQLTARTFAQEIGGMQKDRIVFLLILYIFPEGLYVKSHRQYYDLITAALGVRQAASYEEVLSWFSADKLGALQIAKDRRWQQASRIADDNQTKVITFVHPSYYESLTYLLSSNSGFPTAINMQLFCPILSTFVSSGIALRETSRILSAHFERLPDSARNDLLRRLSDGRASVDYTVEVAIKNNRLIPHDLLNQVLLASAEEEGGALYILRSYKWKLMSLPPDVLASLISRLVRWDSVAGVVVWLIADNFDRVTEEIKKVLLQICTTSKAAIFIASALLYNWQKISLEERRTMLTRLTEEMTDDALCSLLMTLPFIPESDALEVFRQVRHRLVATIEPRLADERAHYMITRRIVSDLTALSKYPSVFGQTYVTGKFDAFANDKRPFVRDESRRIIDTLNSGYCTPQ